MPRSGRCKPREFVKTTTYVTDIEEFFKHADMRTRYFGPALPTSTTVEVRRLSHPEFLVEVEAIAVIASGGTVHGSDAQLRE